MQIIGDASSLSRAYGQASKSGANFGSALGRLAKGAVIAAGAAGVGGLLVAIKMGISEFSQAAKVSAQTGAVIKSTGGAAKVSAQQISDLAGSLMRKSGVDDEAIQSGENMLLTFTRIRNEVGNGNDIFNQATKATLDLSVAMGKDMPSAAILVGKALNDPVRGMTALTRAGIQFTDAQKASIKAMVASGDTMGAQKAILKELTTQFGGSAEAAGKTLPGQLNILRETFSNLAGEIVGGLVPAFSTALGAVSKFVGRLAAAKGFRAKLNIAWTGLKELGGKLGRGIRDAIDKIDWTAVGVSIIAGISAAITGAAQLAVAVAGTIGAAIGGIDWIAIGRVAGPGLAAAIATAFTTLLDPGFWAANWDLALAVALAAFGGPIWKAAGKLGLVAAKALGGAIGSAVLSVASALGRLGPAFLDGIMAAGRIAVAALGRVGEFLAGVASKVVGKLGGLLTFALKILGIQAAINAIGQFATAVWDKMTEAVSAVRGAVGRVVSAAVDIGKGLVRGVFDGIVGLGNLAARLWTFISGQIAGFVTTVWNGAKAIGKAIVQGIWDGILAAKDWLEGKITDWLMGGLLGAAMRALGVASPSKVFAKNVGAPIVQGIAVGMLSEIGNAGNALASGLRGMVAMAKPSADALADAMLSGVTTFQSRLSAGLAAVTNMQARLDSMSAAADARSRARALAEAQAGLAAAVKAHSGIAAAERTLADARTAITRAGLDKRLAAETRAVDLIKAGMEKIKAAAEKLRDTLSGSMSSMADKIMAAFDKLTAAFVAPSSTRNAAIATRRQNEDQAQAVTDAQKSLDAANAGTATTATAVTDAKAVLDAAKTPAAIKAAQKGYDDALQAQKDNADLVISETRRLERAKEDIVITENDRLAAIEKTANDDTAAAQKTALADRLTELQTHFGKEITTVQGAKDAIIAILTSMGIAVPADLLGDAATAAAATANASVIPTQTVDQLVQELKDNGTQWTGSSKPNLSTLAKSWGIPEGRIKVTRPGGGGYLAQPFAKGGIVPGFGTRDSVAAMLTPGEGVISRAGMALLSRRTSSAPASQSTAPAPAPNNITMNIHPSGAAGDDPRAMLADASWRLRTMRLAI